MRRSLMLLAVLVGVCLLSSGAAAATASPPPQIVFSKTGAFSSSWGPYGFWIWCTPPGSTYGGSAGDCDGSMYFYAVPALPSGGSPTEKVEGTVAEVAGAYTMTVWNTTGPFSIACTLTGPAVPTHGPTNNIVVSCTAPGTGTDTATGSVVVVVLS
jgi:hypothetical protein